MALWALCWQWLRHSGTGRGYNGVTQSPTLFNSFNVMGSGYNRGVSVARLPSSTTNTADRILVSSGIDGNSQVEAYNGRTSTRDDAFAAYSNSRAQVFSAALMTIQSSTCRACSEHKTVFESTVTIWCIEIHVATVNGELPLRIAVLKSTTENISRPFLPYGIRFSLSCTVFMHSRDDVLSFVREISGSGTFESLQVFLAHPLADFL